MFDKISQDNRGEIQRAIFWGSGFTRARHLFWSSQDTIQLKLWGYIWCKSLAINADSIFMNVEQQTSAAVRAMKGISVISMTETSIFVERIECKAADQNCWKTDQ